jgi:predicted ATPase
VHAHQVAPLGLQKITALNGRYTYHQQVLAFPPWEEIYCQDAERDQTFFDAIRIFEILSKWYRRCGYTVIEVPKQGVAERCDFILRALGLD